MKRQYDEVISYIEQQIPTRNKLFTGTLGIDRMRALMAYLGNPQDTLKVIHIAGTSGKGSIVNIISRMLSFNGYKVGQTVSPHLQDIRERIQINQKNISKADFVATFEKIFSALEKTAKSKYGHPTYFEIVIAMTYQYFVDKNVDIAVIETGLGGLLDATNVINNSSKISVLARIGKDHTEILGNKLSQIASQKAGIIQNGNTVIALKQSAIINSVFKKNVLIHQAKLIWVDTAEIEKIEISGQDMHVKYSSEKNMIITKLIGIHQAENILVAIKVVQELRKRDWIGVSAPQIRDALRDFSYAGRFETLSFQGKRVVLDGAHNVQKMQALVTTLKKYSSEKYNFIVAFKYNKDYKKMLQLITPIANQIIVTKFEMMQENTGHGALTQNLIAQYLSTKLKHRNTIVCKDYNQILTMISTKENKYITVVTGSLYLIGSIRHFFVDGK